MSLPTRGLLFIGDPHLWSLKPGRRRDASFKKTVLSKIGQAAAISNSRNLWPIFLGDLFHAPDDNDLPMIVELLQALEMFDRKPVTIEGNHDKQSLELSSTNPLALIKAVKRIEVISQPGAWSGLDLTHEDGRRHRVLVGGSPYGHALPTTFKQAFGSKRPAEVDTALWLTHEDLAFEGAYPGSLPLQPIVDVDMVVNGHMHGTKTPVKVEETAYYNPGNITRVSVDMAEHQPAVWEWSPFDNPGMASASGQRVPQLVQHVLEHQPAADAFDFEGRHTSRVTLIKSEEGAAEESMFVSIMKNEPETHRTDDGTYAIETLNHLLDEREATDDLRRICNRLCNEAIRQHQEAR